tara:strand:- start:1432 stop:1767 length:336 start_codon:yes stop_codon:yes gene_type:complete
MPASRLSFNDRIHRNNPILDGSATSETVAPAATATYRPVATGGGIEPGFKGTWMEIRCADPAFGIVNVSINGGANIPVLIMAPLSFAIDPATATVAINNASAVPCSVMFMS